MIARTMTLFRAWRIRTEARREYFAVADSQGRAFDVLDATADHEQRAFLLATIAGLEMRTAELHLLGFGPERLDDEDRDRSESYRLTSWLYGALSSAELAMAHRGWRTAAWPRIESTGGEILDRVVAAGRLDEDLLRQLLAAVEPVVGAEAVAALARLPLGPQE